jgi:hypothetical protein
MQRLRISKQLKPFFRLEKYMKPGRQVLGLLWAISAFFILYLIFYFTVLVEPPNPSKENIITTGWDKLQPVSASAFYMNRSFSVDITNTLSREIKVFKVAVNETITRDACTVTSPIMGSTVKAGERFTLRGSDCPFKLEDDSYDLLVSLEYNVSSGTGYSILTDGGHIKGAGAPL